MADLETLRPALATALGDRIRKETLDRGQVTLDIDGADFVDAAKRLRDDPALAFSELLDLVGVDYQGYSGWDGKRYAIVYILLSIKHNWRVRVRVFCADDEFPGVESVIGVWPSANWYEREAFDLYGIVFRGHPDLRRILTDYGFIGHPFRKDFPLIGNVEVRYDADKQRVVYEPVTIENRTLVPKVIRHDNRYDAALKTTK